MNRTKDSYLVLGLMSGTSLDGLDLCLTRFWSIEKQYKHEIVAAKTIEYSNDWMGRLSHASELSAQDLHQLDREYGSLLGKLSKDFLEEKNLMADLIASHGHTVFHQPDKRMSVQIGHGAFIAASSGIDVVNDFRSSDTANGGQGAPLVPLAEKYLFPKYSSFLNIGGIANLSIHQADGNILGYDVCGANQLMNWISKKFFNEEFDDGGRRASQGKVIPELLDKLDQIEFYDKAPPRSLGREDIESDILPLFDNYENGADLLHTFNTHMARQIYKAFNKHNINGPILLSGGGVYNQFLLQLFNEEGLNYELADPLIIEYKEALCFSLLGLLRMNLIPNSLSTVTGASKDSINGSHFIA